MDYATIEVVNRDRPAVFEEEIEASYNKIASQVGNPIQRTMWSANRFDATASVQRFCYFTLRSCLPLFYLLGFLLSLFILASTTKEGFEFLFLAIRTFWISCWLNFEPSWAEWLVTACGAIARLIFGVLGSIAIVIFMIVLMGLLVWGVSVVVGQLIFVALSTTTSLTCLVIDNLIALLRWALRKSYKLLHFGS